MLDKTSVNGEQEKTVARSLKATYAPTHTTTDQSSAAKWHGERRFHMLKRVRNSIPRRACGSEDVPNK